MKDQFKNKDQLINELKLNKQALQTEINNLTLIQNTQIDTYKSTISLRTAKIKELKK